MPQVTDWSIDRAGGLAVRAQMNGVFEALQSCSSGPTAPSPTVAGMLWFDTGVSPPVPRQRNAANTAWNRLIDTADLAASRAALGAPAEPQTAAGIGQAGAISSAVGAALVLPAGGRWLFSAFRVNGTGNIISSSFGEDAGGATIGAAAAGQNWTGFGWRFK